MNQFLKVTIQTDSNIDVLSSLLINLGSTGIVESDKVFEAYFNEDDFSEKQLNELLIELQKDFEFTFSIEKIDTKNWNEEWEKNYQPIIIDDFVSIYAPFHNKDKKTKYQLVIDPRMAFGTGHHETTELMIQNMRQIDFSGKTVLDLGSGTGILAIIAQLEGASQVTAVDFDPNAFSIMQENFIINNTPSIISILGTMNEVKDHFDVILANINRNTLLEINTQLVEGLNENGQLILSGFYKDDLVQIREAYEKLGMDLVAEKEKNSWCSVIFKQKN